MRKRVRWTGLLVLVAAATLALSGGSFSEEAKAGPPVCMGTLCGGPGPPPPPPPGPPGTPVPPPPPPPTYAACSNGSDDDGDGKVDYPADPGCTDYGDPDEYNAAGTPPPPQPGQPQPSDEALNVLNPEYYAGTLSTQDNPYSVVTPGIGCAHVGDAVAYSRPGRWLWKWGVEVVFCWNGAKVTSLYSHNTQIQMNQPPWPFSIAQKWQGSANFTLAGAPGNYSTIVRADAKFEFCTFKYGCMPPQQPYVRIMLAANGSATCSTNTQPYGHPCYRVPGP